MPGTPLPKSHWLRPVLTLCALAALLTLGTLVTGCAPRQPIPVDEPRVSPAPPAQTPAAPAKAPVAKAKPAKAKPAETKPGETKDEAAAPAEQAAPAPAQQATPAVAERPVYVQVGAFGTAMNALGAVAWLKNKGYENSRMVRVEQGQGALFKVQAGPFQDLAAAHKALDELKPDWPQAFIPLD